MDLFDIIACPNCKARLERDGATLTCTTCGQRYPIIDGKPVLYPDARVPEHIHESELVVRMGYDPWVHRVVMQSLPPSAIMLDMGSGNMAVNLPNVVRMDTLITPFADVVGDAHALPFLPGIFDYVLSLAVVEHLRNPFLAAQETYAALREGGYVYGDCNFVFPYHGYPHHYFNATEQGMDQAFGIFRKLRSGVGPFQMPSFAIRAILENYRNELGHGGEPDVSELQALLAQILDHPLGTYDARFDEQSALRLAAGTFFVGVKSQDGASEVIPQAVQDIYARTPALQQRFSDLLDLAKADNIMVWALGEGRQEYPEIAEYFASLTPFRKHGTVDEHWVAVFESWPVIEARFGNIRDAARETLLAQRNSHGDTREHYIAELEAQLAVKNRHIASLEQLIARISNGRVMRLLNWASGNKQ